MSTVRELLGQAKRLLCVIETARLDAEVLLAAALNTQRSRLYAWPEAEVSRAVDADYHALLRKRRQGFPVAYLLGKKEFRALELKVTPATLIPRPETECLVELALARIPEDAAMDVLDLGTGSGAIAIAIAKERPRCRILATDLSRAALAVAQANIRDLAIENIRLRQSDWFASLGGESFDLILSNPPYVEASDPGFANGAIRFEPRLALDAGPHGFDAINCLIPAARQHLHKGACLLLEHGHRQGEDIRRLFKLHRYHAITTQRDYAGLERISLGSFA